MNEPGLYGMMAEFHDPDAVVEAARAARAEGYRAMDAYTPYPVEELDEPLNYHTRGRLSRIVFVGGLLGAVGGFALQWWASVIYYPLNVGGRPFNSWPAFIPITFETTVLLAALSAVLGMLALNGLPRPYHPVFNVPQFALASRDRFFLCIEAEDPKFSAEETRRFLEAQRPTGVYDVPR
jgi:hypothetical protein